MPRFREVTGQFVGYTPDTVDPDIGPDRVPMNGRVTFTPQFTGGLISFPRLVPPEFAHPEPIEARIVDGFVMVEVSDGETLTLQPLSLMMTVDDEATQNWSWRADFSEVYIGGDTETTAISPWSFRVPGGVGPVDLTELIPVTSSPGLEVVKGPRGHGITSIVPVAGGVVISWEGGDDVTVPVPTPLPDVPVATATDDGLMSAEDKAKLDGIPAQARVPSDHITDSTMVGRALVTAQDAAAARNAIGAGTSSQNLSPGTSTDLIQGQSATPMSWSAEALASAFEYRATRTGWRDISPAFNTQWGVFTAKISRTNDRVTLVYWLSSPTASTINNRALVAATGSPILAMGAPLGLIYFATPPVTINGTAPTRTAYEGTVEPTGEVKERANAGGTTSGSLKEGFREVSWITNAAFPSTLPGVPTTL